MGLFSYSRNRDWGETFPHLVGWHIVLPIMEKASESLQPARCSITVYVVIPFLSYFKTKK